MLSLWVECPVLDSILWILVVVGTPIRILNAMEFVPIRKTREISHLIL